MKFQLELCFSWNSRGIYLPLVFILSVGGGDKGEKHKDGTIYWRKHGLLL